MYVAMPYVDNGPVILIYNNQRDEENDNPTEGIPIVVAETLLENIRGAAILVPMNSDFLGRNNDGNEFVLIEGRIAIGMGILIFLLVLLIVVVIIQRV
jgi:hypothetical protein